MGKAKLENIAALLWQFRRRTGLKQEAVAEHLGVSQGYYSRLESGRLMPSTAVYNRITALVASPAFEDAAVRWRKAVRHSYSPVSMVVADRDTVRILEVSQGFRAMGGVYARLRTWDVLENILGEDFDRQAIKLRAMGAFDGALNLVRNIWVAGGAEQTAFFKAVTTVLPDENYKYVLYSQNVEISEQEYNSYAPDERITALER
ncbi:XRE family transcriptional regulator [Glycocaulis alkaliphilus]|uniref:XRE family transcriptional regulator n=1 Tax=Glycocaulis alkaliphilus TaxID=1434191 RepID=A0A3T0E702_9PROT|nr:helix-turn-helix transcriptional regulator [Glycocaulis alkaliphilus]AZU03195.1 XRE family transcriptional regulator [Glycocaulis alkaliphilus]GGB71691.1 hypothetical protein GCM10007417_09410 [Glycocaulis alkaliphilus]